MANKNIKTICFGNKELDLLESIISNHIDLMEENKVGNILFGAGERENYNTIANLREKFHALGATSSVKKTGELCISVNVKADSDLIEIVKRVTKYK